ncbi:MAG: hypothetical protein ABSC92_17730, partial [Rhizomicrobium sp.]
MSTRESTTALESANAAGFGGRVRAAWLGWQERRAARQSQEMFYRHTIPVRVLHWINAVCLA